VFVLVMTASCSATGINSIIIKLCNVYFDVYCGDLSIVYPW
jgi:hypothetical protein